VNIVLLSFCTIMKPLEGDDFTLVELKNALKKKGLPTKRAKTELSQWLSELDSNIWKISSEKLNKVPCEEGTSSAVMQETTDESMETGRRCFDP